MTISHPTPDLGPDWDLGLDAVEAGPDGQRYWPELFVAQVMGWRPLTARLRVPAGVGPHPLVIYIHGGGWLKGHPRLMTPSRREMRMPERLLEAGYALAEITYRLAGEGPFPMQIHDCAAAVRYFRHHAGHFGLDPDRFAAFGSSAGGHMALLLGVERPPELEGEVGITGPSSRVQAVVDWYGVADLMIPYRGRSLAERLTDPQNAIARLLGGPAAGEAGARAASPVTYATANAAPCLIQHGTKDSVVTFDHAEAMRDALAAAGAHVELDAIEGAEHGFPDVDTTPIMPRAIAFLDRWLK